MRIPAQLIPFLPDEIGNKPLAEDNGPRPVRASSAFGSTLPDALATQEWARSKRSTSPWGKNDHPEFVPNRRQTASRAGADEPRRKEIHPVFLDTRRLPSRRKSDPHSAIDIEI
jgi:hypothetical protein